MDTWVVSTYIFTCSVHVHVCISWCTQAVISNLTIRVYVCLSIYNVHMCISWSLHVCMPLRMRKYHYLFPRGAWYVYNMYIYVYIYIHTHTYIHTYIYTRTHAQVACCIFLFICLYLCTQTYIYTCIHYQQQVYKLVWHVHVFTCIRTYIHAVGRPCADFARGWNRKHK
jgi:hypothetical protein